jgi:internalin A
VQGNLEHLTKLPNLQDIRLDNTFVSDAGLDQLKRLPLLQHLTLGETKVSDAGVRGLQDALPKLRIAR